MMSYDCVCAFLFWIVLLCATSTIMPLGLSCKAVSCRRGWRA